ncbi:MAG TPA: glycine zipper 2TM domain-containing protein [Rhodocyclaceae bacterium]|nr:glycine zipper 2TM domain-containing protein [Rhodocyclaceae bacterium]
MKRILLAAALLLPLASMADYRERPRAPMAQSSNVIQDSTEYARVLDSKPIPGPVQAQQVCSAVATPPPPEHNTAGAVIGGLTGALLGSRFGGGNGKNATTIAGAVAGAMVGDRVGSADAGPQQECHTIYEAGPPAGYQVTYEYQGKLLTTTTAAPPGQFLRVRKLITVE